MTLLKEYETHIWSTSLWSVCSRHSLIPELLPADAQGVSARPVGDDKNLLRPVVHQPLQVLRQVVFIGTHGCASVCACLVVAVIGLCLGQPHHWLMSGRCCTGRWLLWLIESPWPGSRPWEDVHTHTHRDTICLLSHKLPWIWMNSFGVRHNSTYCVHALCQDTVASALTLWGKEDCKRIITHISW